MSRPCHCRRIAMLPAALRFSPCEKGCPDVDVVENSIPIDCLEALRLADFLGMGMDEAAQLMGISRHTFGRLLRKGRFVVAEALCLGRALRIENCDYALNNISKGELMSDQVIVAVPSEAPGGLEAAPSAHFGHCAAYTIATIENGAIKDSRVVPNQGHAHGGCVQPVQELAKDGVTVLLAGGMGMKPLAAMAGAGIRPYFSAGFSTVKDALEAFAAGKLQPFGSGNLCKGGCGGHHHHN